MKYRIKHRMLRIIGPVGVLLTSGLLMLPAHSDMKKAWLGVKGVTCAT